MKGSSGVSQRPAGDLGAKRQQQMHRMGRQFKADGPDVRAASRLPVRAPKIASREGRKAPI